MDCHSAEGYGPCLDNPNWLAFKCAEMKAKMYVDFIDNPSCLKDMYSVHPNFAEWYKYCGALGLASYYLFILIAFIIVFCFYHLFIKCFR